MMKRGRYWQYQTKRAVKVLDWSGDEWKKGVDEQLMSWKKQSQKPRLTEWTKYWDTPRQHLQHLYSGARFMLWAKQLSKKRLKQNEKERNKKNRKDQIGDYKSLKSSLKNWDRSWLVRKIKFLKGILKRKLLKRKMRFSNNCKNEKTKKRVGVKNSYLRRKKRLINQDIIT